MPMFWRTSVKIAPPSDRYLTHWYQGRRKHTNVILLLQTPGGDANTAYRIARCFQREYQTVENTGAERKEEKKGEFIVFVNTRCKSAGTLLATGANKIVLAEGAELGPIDVQLRNPEEVGEQTSGLTPLQSLLFLETQSTTLFNRHFRSLRFSQALSFSTKMSAEIATNITIGLLAPLYSQIDRIRLAEMDRSLKIATEYGERIGRGNLKPNALERLLSAYPSHGFVIDREEAKELFKYVEEPSAELRTLANECENMADYYESRDVPWFHFLSDEPPESKTAKPETIESKVDSITTDGSNKHD